MCLTLTRSIPIDRESLRSGAKFITRAEIEINRGSSIMLFPEGTRSKTAEPCAFLRKGPSCWLKGPDARLSPLSTPDPKIPFPETPGSWGKPHIRIRVLDEIPAETVKKLDVKSLMNLTRERMEAGLFSLEQG